MDNKNSWVYNLPSNVYGRLCACRNIKEDLPALVNTRWAWMKNQERYAKFTKEDALVYILDLLDANSQWQLCDMTSEEYDELKR